MREIDDPTLKMEVILQVRMRVDVMGVYVSVCVWMYQTELCRDNQSILQVRE